MHSQIHGPGKDNINMEDLLKSQEEAHQMKAKLKEYEKLMEETTRSWEERLRRAEDRKIEEAEQLKVCHLVGVADNVIWVCHCQTGHVTDVFTHIQ